MKKFLYTLLAAVAVLAVSCIKEDEAIIPTKEEEGAAQEAVNIARYVTFSASTPLTKVALDGEGNGSHNATWQDADYNKVMLVWNDGGTAKTAQSTAISIEGENASHATITFGIAEEDLESYKAATELYSVYPYVKLNGNVSFVDGKLAVNFKNTQNAGTSFSDAAWYAAKTTSSSKSFTFHPISTIIQFTLNGTKLPGANRVYFRSVSGLNRLYGTAAITFSDEDGYPLTLAPVLSDGKSDGSANVTFIPKILSTYGEGTFYVPIPGYGTDYVYETGQTSPGQASDGFIIQIKTAEASPVPAAYYAAQITQSAGKFYKITNPVETKVYDNYYVAQEGTGDGLSVENAATLASLKANVAAFKYSDKIAGALLLNGATINYLGDDDPYTAPLEILNTSADAPAYAYTIKGGIGGGTTTFTTTSSATFNNVKATVTLEDMTFSGCSAAKGAALSISGGKVQVRNCKFMNNVATGLAADGGAIDVSSTGTLYLDKCYFKDNYRQEKVGASSATNSGLGYDIGAVTKTTTLCLHNCTLDNSKLGLQKTTGDKALLPNAGSVQTKGVTLIINSSFKGAGNSGRGCYSIGYYGVNDSDADKAILCNSTFTHASKPAIWSAASKDGYTLKFDYCLVKSVNLNGTPNHITSGEHNATGAFTMGADSGNGYFAAPTLPGGYSAPTKAQIESYVSGNPAWSAFRQWLGDEWGKDQAGNSRGTEDSSVWTPGSIQ